jgi:hypothetical protein
MTEWWNGVDRCTLGGIALLGMVLVLLAYTAWLKRSRDFLDRVAQRLAEHVALHREERDQLASSRARLSKWYLAACCEMQAKDPQWCPPDRRGL